MLRALIGSRGERLAARRLRRAGFRILARNYRALEGEIDLIASDGQQLLFVEVKTRTAHSELLASSVPHAKQQHVIRAARSYMQSRGVELPARFDVILVDLTDRPPTVDWIEGAFSAPAL